MKTEEPITIRKEVFNFAYLMEETLCKNDFKGGWKNENVFDLFRKLNREVSELKNELERGSDVNQISECCDIANYVMMIADILSQKGKLAEISYNIICEGCKKEIPHEMNNEFVSICREGELSKLMCIDCFKNIYIRREEDD